VGGVEFALDLFNRESDSPVVAYPARDEVIGLNHD
jgi:hypothetical protein